MSLGVDDARQLTIVAIATAQGRSAIGIVRLSGPESKRIAETICQQTLKVRYAHYSRYTDSDLSLIDEGITIYFAAPSSFTGEDVVEFHTHGSTQALALLQQRCMDLGARLARPGEFSERAFLNGKIDLSQAEAIADIIDAQSEQGLKSANESLQGEFKYTIEQILSMLIELRAYVEGALDFPEEEIDFLADKAVINKHEGIIGKLQQALTRSKQASLLRHGVNVVLTGEPNVGKSTLLNRLCGKDVAIVTEVPGTTRDRLEQVFYIDGVPITVVDTAGIRETQDVVEEEGVKRAKQAVDEADIIIAVYDATRIVEKRSDIFDLSKTTAPVISVYNKIDLVDHLSEHTEINVAEPVLLSATTGEGIDRLLEKIARQIQSKSFSDNPRIVRTRHVDALNRCLETMLVAKQLLIENVSAEMIAEELLLAQNSLSEITGDYLPDELLGEIFSRFCLGK